VSVVSVEQNRSDRAARVLVADDDDIARKAMAETLIRHGFEVLEARNGAEAIEVLRALEDPVDVVLCDVIMPLGGTVLRDVLVQTYPSLRFVFVSAYSRDLVGASMPDVKPPAFVHKPFRPDVLVDAIRAALGRADAGSP
jgi:two-component system, cell cycle sensor histidine kinase and response regulator CckA